MVMGKETHGTRVNKKQAALTPKEKKSRQANQEAGKIGRSRTDPAALNDGRSPMH
jgi:hypothetical protein